jgi:hypothetical protein
MTIEQVVVKEDEFEVWDEDSQTFQSKTPSNFYVLISTGDRIFYVTKDRMAAQKQADEDWGVGKYKIRVVRDLKGKSKQENGGQSVYATATRARPSSRPPK